MQYTIRNIPSILDRLLRRHARSRGTSLNEAALEVLARGVGLSETAVRRRDLSQLAGTWRKDAAFDQAIRDQDAVDERIWP